MVADNESGKSVQSEVRTSSGMFLEKRQVSTNGPCDFFVLDNLSQILLLGGLIGAYFGFDLYHDLDTQAKLIQLL